MVITRELTKRGTGESRRKADISIKFINNFSKFSKDGYTNIVWVRRNRKNA